MSAEVNGRVCELAAVIFDVDPTAVSPGSTPADIAPWDSLALLNLMVALEDEYGIELPPEEVAEAPDLAAIARLVAKHTAR